MGLMVAADPRLIKGSIERTDEWKSCMVSKPLFESPEACVAKEVRGSAGVVGLSRENCYLLLSENKTRCDCSQTCRKGMRDQGSGRAVCQSAP